MPGPVVLAIRAGRKEISQLLPVPMAIARGRLPPDEARRTIANLSVITATGAGLCHPLTGLTARPGSGPSHTRDRQNPVSGA